MTITTRPSKTFLFNILEVRLKQLTSSNGLDAASAGFKNKRMFMTNYYYGLDIDLLAIKNGLSKYNDNKTFGILGDLNNLEKIPANAFNVVVSTNSLDHLKHKENAVEQLARLVSPKGTIILHFAVDDELDIILDLTRTTFDKVEIKYLKNPISMAYETFFERNGNLGYHPVASSKPFLIISWLLSRLEYLTTNFRGINDQAILIASEKRCTKNGGSVDLSTLPKISEKIYNVLN